jgi:hypothetical protein
VDSPHHLAEIDASFRDGKMMNHRGFQLINVNRHSSV